MTTEESQVDWDVLVALPHSLGLNCPPTPGERTRAGHSVCEGSRTHRANSDPACSCFGGLKTRREAQLSALLWLVMIFNAGDTILAMEYGRLASSERCPTASSEGKQNPCPPATHGPQSRDFHHKRRNSNNKMLWKEGGGGK